MKENVNIKRNVVIVIKIATLDFLRFFFGMRVISVEKISIR